ncbi:MAG TPA: class I SAM-dependent methyltransferase [Cyclobacteriaceae bacterium]|nr:class I SAM-dependent methyltransferase [Cyclobacteriaceae bacterium]
MPERKRNGFDFLAPYYDKLTSLVFGGEIRRAQVHFLKSVPPCADVLVLGGGTGWIISEILLRQPDCHIWFIDSSSAMIDRARKMNPDTNHVTYICGTTDQIPQRNFSAIILPFFLDLFSTAHLSEVIGQIALASNIETRWLITDFVNGGKWWQKSLLMIMYFFFRIICNIEAIVLPDWREVLHEMAFIKIETGLFYHGFIESHHYRIAPGT